MKIILSIALVFITVISYGQVNIQWLQDTEGVSIAVDGSDNVYTVYYEYNPAGDIYLTKRDTDGNIYLAKQTLIKLIIQSGKKRHG